MILWFLRLFPVFHQIAMERSEALTNLADRESDLVFCRARNQELETENIRLNDRLEAANEERARLWKLAEESLANERQAYQMRANEHWQKQYGVKPYPEAPGIPENLGHQENGVTEFGRRGRLLPSEIVAQAETDFWAAKARQAAESKGHVAHTGVSAQ